MAVTSIRATRTKAVLKRTHSFRFVDENLNRKLVALLKKRAKGKCAIDEEGFIHYSHDNEDLIGNDLISAVRASVFPSWQVLAFPAHWADSYKRYMLQRGIPFQEEVRDDERRFLIERGRRPHRWNLEQPSMNGR